MAKYMLIMRASDEAHKAMENVSFDEILETMGRYNDELMKAGVLLAAEGLDPEVSVVVDYSSTPPLVTDGPYGETKELFGGFYLIDVPTLEEAVEWARRMPAGPGAKTEVRRIPSIDEFPAENEYVYREKAWRQQNGQL
ncbi:YciI family protein [Kineosporia rhizophila]|uniref:YciI family protein n=1 Tax=Kineosporia TaxID=49184 RepID=UPI000AC07CFA|nr:MULTISPECIES: YciI family protein [Kineosporia]MCE0538091.1 YciI family protein [Kineosporia rhizophila]GLY14919.1 transcription initiation protein [Kineosporia sp. NBRC 101677]